MPAYRRTIDRRTGLLGLAAAVIAPACPVPARDRLVSWRETVGIEHQDRIRHIERLSREQMIAPPQLYTILVGRGDLPPAFGVDIPVLRVVFDHRVFFDTDRDAMRPEAERVIDVVAEALRRGAADTAVFIAGHTDSRGSDAHNYFLSVRRAESAAVTLSLRQIPQTSIRRIGFGKAVPLVPNTSDENMARNRRVEFVIGSRAEAVARALANQRSLVCPTASPAQRETCLKDFVELPPVEAAPVRNGEVGRRIRTAPPAPPEPAPGMPDVTGKEQVIIPTIRSQDLVEPGRPTERVSIGPAGTPPVAVEIPPDARRTVEIRPDEPVVIDLRESRVLVERLER